MAQLKTKRLLVVAALLGLLALSPVGADEDTHEYTSADAIRVYASKIGPINNPLETYDFFREPGCPPAGKSMKPPTLGQALAGDELYLVNMSILFGTDVSNGPVCKFAPTKDDVARWAYMIRNQYSYKLVVDGLPVWAALGFMNGDRPHIYTHRSLFLGYNKNQLVNVSLKTGKGLPVEENLEYYFTYSARFLRSKTRFEDRYAVYVNHKALRPNARWYSIANSILIVIFLVTIVLIIISRTLRADFAKMEDERRLRLEGHDTFDNSGWKQIYADVFRVPRCPSLLTAVVGSGIQLFVLTILTIVAAALDSTNPIVGDNRAGMAVVLYAVTSFIGGYVSSSEFARFSVLVPALAPYWTRSFGLTQIVLPGLFFASTMVTNTIATLYGSAQVIHFGSLMLLCAIWLLVSCPLSLAGTVIGRYVNRRSKRRKDVPHVNQIPRLIPKPRRFLTRPLVLFLASGALPFMSIFVEIYLVLTSFWQDKSYQLYGFLALALAIFTIVTACISIASIFILLNMENHHWRWMSFLFGASTAVYIFAYATYFFLFKTKMNGLFMTVFYFSYSFFFCAMVACIGGSISYKAAEVFVTRIYMQAKRD